MPGGPAAPVQRFPANALTSPVPWSQFTGGVARPGEGISGSVYILDSNQKDPPIDKVVVKPVFGETGIGTETGEQLQFGDRALSSLLGVATPVSKIVHPRTREFAELVTLLRPHQPPPPPLRTDPDEPITWKDLSAAHSFIVMSKVPNAKSISSHAKEAATDEKAKADLYRIVFSKSFLEQLARMSVGDLLVGNNDRLVLGASNLGNIMISMSEQKDPTLYAIDTTALLPKAVDTERIVSTGSAIGGGFNTMKSTMNAPEERLDGFYRMLVSHMKSADRGGHPDGAAPWQLFENTYKEQKDRIELDFLLAWRKTLLEIRAMVSSREGREKMKGLTRGYAGTRGEQTLGYAALKANAMYLGSRTSKANTHDESTADPASYYAYSKLAALDRSRFLPPVDELTPAVDVTMPGVARKYTHSLPPYIRPEMAYHVATSAKDIPPENGVSAVKDAVSKYEEQLAKLGTKKRGVFKRAEVERNRVLAGKYIANVFRLAAGEGRLRHHMWKVGDAAKDVVHLLGGNMARAKVAKVLPDAARSIMSSFATLNADADAYRPKITQAESDLGSAKDSSPTSSKLANAFQRSGDLLDTEQRNLKAVVRTGDKDVLVDAIRDYVNS